MYLLPIPRLVYLQHLERKRHLLIVPIPTNRTPIHPANRQESHSHAAGQTSQTTKHHRIPNTTSHVAQPTLLPLLVVDQERVSMPCALAASGGGFGIALDWLVDMYAGMVWV